MFEQKHSCKKFDFLSHTVARSGSGLVMHLPMEQWVSIYRIAENFQRRKCLRIGDFYREKFHRLLTFATSEDTTPQNFTEKAFTNSHKTMKFTNIFSFESFPLYGK